MRKVFFALLLFTAILNACTEKSEKSQKHTHEETKTEAPAPQAKKLESSQLKEKVGRVNDSMNTVWKEMIASDDQKFSDIKRLLQEVSYTSDYNILKYRKLVALTDSVYSLRYSQDSMTSKGIDKYDIATGILLKEVLTFIEETPEMENHSISKTLLSDIQKADNDIVNYRIRYDRWAKEYNQLIYDYKDSLQQFGDPYSSFSSKPIFELQS